MSERITLNQNIREAKGFFPDKPFINPDKAFYKPNMKPLAGKNDLLELNGAKNQIVQGFTGIKSFLMSVKGF